VTVVRAPSAAVGDRTRTRLGAANPPGAPPSVGGVPARFEAFDRAHLTAILGLCDTEGWSSLPADPDRASRALVAPGVTTVVAVDADEVIGFATLLSDGEIDAYLSALLVAEARRHEGVGRELLHVGFRRTGATRVDLLAADGTDGFYAMIPHRRFSGFRLYPDSATVPASGSPA
jgi:GNAT superfamily N-acetyltransferase